MLLNENRNRVPAGDAPIDGVTEGKVGDMILENTGDPNTANLHVCLVASGGTGSPNGSVWGAISTA